METKTTKYFIKSWDEGEVVLGTRFVLENKLLINHDINTKEKIYILPTIYVLSLRTVWFTKKIILSVPS